MKRSVRVTSTALILGLILVGAIFALWTNNPFQNNTAVSHHEVGNGDLVLGISTSEPLDEMNALFTRTEGWIGADGAYSVPLKPDRILWLFSDTWVGRVQDGKRVDATIVNNSAAIQEGLGAKAAIRFAIRRGADGKAEALIAPADGNGWFWLQAGLVIDEHMIVFLPQIEKAGDPGAFGFRQVGQCVGRVANPNDDPTSWRIEQHKLPHTIFSPERLLSFGTALIEKDGYLYIYGTDEDRKTAGINRYLIVARVPSAQVLDFTAWEFYHDGAWQPDFRKSSRLVPGMASECSVTYLPDRQRYVLIYTEGGLSERILARSSPQPWGPWSEPVTVYQCPEVGWDRRIFCYGAKAHGSLSFGDDLVVSYFANSYDFWHVAADARLYWPKFIRTHLTFKNVNE
jgi:hypothetical protein